MSNKLFFGLAVSLFVIGFSAFSLMPQAPTAEVNWYTWEDAVAANANYPKKIYVDIYTKWCGPCKFMDKTTFRDPEVVRYLNENFYPVKLDAERKEALTHDGITHQYIPFQGRGYHQFAASLMEGKLSYPTSVFLTPEYVIEQRIAGALNPAKMLKVLKYVAEETIKENPKSWKDYQVEYDKNFAQKKLKKH